jgi:hypothetical protein
MYGIVELRRTAENNWKAKYQGNYGIYTIKIKTDGEKTVEFLCSCPSDYYPCKHIAIIEEAVAEQTAINKKQDKNDGEVKELLRGVSAEKLQEFIADQTKYNDELLNAVLLEFAANTKNIKGNKYSRIIQRALASVDLHQYEDDYYSSEEGQNIDILDQWFDKAGDCVRQKHYDEAILICKACIEEYSQWLYNTGEDASLFFSEEYQSIPFDIMEEAAEYANRKSLFDYCLAEMKKKKYVKTDFYYQFHRLLGNIAVTIDPDAFIALQDELLSEIKDKSSDDAETVLRRKIDFCKRIDREDNAWVLIEENIQIESFRMELAVKKTEERNFLGAKKLINDFIAEQKQKQDSYINSAWYKLLLDIAQEEDDIPAIRKLAYGFIKNSFNMKYYEIYKITFSDSEWIDEREKLFQHYDEKYFNRSAADFLVAEKEIGRLLNYVEKNISVQELEHYYKEFSSAYPEKTLELFRKVIVPYAENNVGRYYYEYIFSLLKKICHIKGGKKIASDLVADFQMRYKNRRAMMEILRKF